MSDEEVIKVSCLFYYLRSKAKKIEKRMYSSRNQYRGSDLITDLTNQDLRQFQLQKICHTFKLKRPVYIKDI